MHEGVKKAPRQTQLSQHSIYPTREVMKAKIYIYWERLGLERANQYQETTTKKTKFGMSGLNNPRSAIDQTSEPHHCSAARRRPDRGGARGRFQRGLDKSDHIFAFRICFSHLQSHSTQGCPASHNESRNNRIPQRKHTNTVIT